MTGDRVEQIIEEALQRGDFDDLPGAGAPIPGLGSVDPPDWWARRFVERERQRAETRDLVERINRSLPRILAMDAEAPMRRALEDLNEAIAACNARLADDERLVPLDVDRLIGARSHRWNRS